LSSNNIVHTYTKYITKIKFAIIQTTHNNLILQNRCVDVQHTYYISALMMMMMMIYSLKLILMLILYVRRDKIKTKAFQKFLFCENFKIVNEILYLLINEGNFKILHNLGL